MNPDCYSAVYIQPRHKRVSIITRFTLVKCHNPSIREPLPICRKCSQPRDFCLRPLRSPVRSRTDTTCYFHDNGSSHYGSCGFVLPDRYAAFFPGLGHAKAMLAKSSTAISSMEHRIGGQRDDKHACEEAFFGRQQRETVAMLSQMAVDERQGVDENPQPRICRDRSVLDPNYSRNRSASQTLRSALDNGSQGY